MGRIKFDEVEKYGNTNSNSYFSLKDDGDVARVRFMYDSVEDVEGHAVHEVEVDGKRRYVNCLRSYNEPIHNCPFCASGKFQLAKLFVPIYDVDSGTIKVWGRGKRFFAKINGLCARYPHLCSHIFEIERHGKKGDTSTTYEIFEVERDDTTLNDLPELPIIVGTTVLDKTAEEMQEYLDTGSFGDGSSQQNRGSVEPVRRRTPATSGSEVF